MTSRRYLLVGNPTARSGKGLDHLDAVLRAMRQVGADVTLLKTEPGGRTPAAVAEAVDGGGFDVVVYAGGDGTFADVAKGVLRAKRRVPMGLMPGGTANDQGQSFGLASGVASVERNVAVLLAHHVVHMDVGTVTRIGEDGRELERDLWFDNMGLGFASAVLARRNRARQTVGKIPVLRDVYRDQAVYAGALVHEAIKSFVEPTRFDAEVVADGVTWPLSRVTDIVVNNTPVFGGEWIPVRTATATDGRLDLVALQGQRELLASLILEHKQAITWDLPSVQPFTLTAARFDITALRPRGAEAIPSQIDGEEWHAGTRFDVGVLPGALPVIVPADFEPPWKP